MKKGIIKTAPDIEGIAASGAILSRVLHELKDMVQPGITTGELNDYAERRIAQMGGTPSFKGYGGKNPFPAGLCTSINEVLVHGVPSREVSLEQGDIVGLDLGVNYKGFFSDGAVTVPVGTINKVAQKLIRVTQEALDAAIAEAWPGKHMGDVGYAMQRIAEKNGFSVARQLIGHGVGYAVHEEPEVPCYGRRGEGVVLQPGMVLAIEPMVCEKGYRLVFEPGEWPVRTEDRGLTAHFEHTVAITHAGPKILT